MDQEQDKPYKLDSSSSLIHQKINTHKLLTIVRDHQMIIHKINWSIIAAYNDY